MTDLSLSRLRGGQAESATARRFNDWSERVTTRFATPVVLAFLVVTAAAGQAPDLSALWDYDHPQLSEQRFRAALQTASGDDALILTTQIARTQGLRKQFAKARATLLSIEKPIAQAGPEAQTRWWLEMGRTWSSAAHAPATQTRRAKADARAAYAKAIALARAAQLDDLQVDGLHMMAFVDTAPADQLRWDQQALEVATSSSQAAANRWEASIRNNLGVTLHDLHRHEEALQQFEAALAIRERQGKDAAIRDARYMVAWDLHALGRNEEALAILLQLEKDNDAAHAPDRSVYEELEALYRAKGDASRAGHYARLKRSTPG